jgi:hypothetical protein
MAKNEILRALGSQVKHSPYYHKRYEGWMEKIEEDGQGRRRIVRAYAGEYYRQDLSDAKRRLVRLLHPVFYAAGTAAFLFAASRDTASNRAAPAQLICFAAVLVQIALLLFLLAYEAAPRRMTVWERYAGPVRLKWASLAAAVLMGAEVPAIAVFLLLGPAGDLGAESASAAGYAAAAASMLAMHLTERRIRYAETPNEAPPLRGGYYIDS